MRFRLLLVGLLSIADVHAKEDRSLSRHPILLGKDPMVEEKPSSPAKYIFWSIPFASSSMAYSTFPWVSRAFHKLVLWASHDTWIPSSREQIDLQANIVTQVINGPVITSVSVLLATLVSVTVSSLHQRQKDIHRSMLSQVSILRYLQDLYRHQPRVLQLLQAQMVAATERPSSRDPHAYIASHLYPLRSVLSSQQHMDLWDRLWTERLNQWLAEDAGFPTAHYLTLFFLATTVVVSFLVATDEGEVVFGSLPVRILWSLLIGSLTALGVVCHDLSHAFEGAYRVMA